MKRFVRFAVMSLVLIGMAPPRLHALEKCGYVWVRDVWVFETEIDAMVLTRYYKWYCDGQPTPP